MTIPLLLVIIILDEMMSECSRSQTMNFFAHARKSAGRTIDVVVLRLTLSHQRKWRRRALFLQPPV